MHQRTMNYICRNSPVYPVLRSVIPDDKHLWSVPLPAYSPPYFTADHLLKNCPWADPEIGEKNFEPKWNAQDGDIDRTSHDYNKPFAYLVVDNYPLNPRGRTGLRGRGRLGRWGPNHAADAIVTRWKRAEDNSKVLNPATGKPILQFLAILRKDCRKWAMPGGFLNAGEKSLKASLRELFEEAIDIEKLTPSAKRTMHDFFSNEKEIYKGYVDDPRNTDNAWIETTATNYHDETGNKTELFVLNARDDAADVKWCDIVNDMEIYETHSEIIKSVDELYSQCQEKTS